MIFGNVNGVRCCKDCKDRYLGCHDKCETYINAKEEYEQRKKAYEKNVKEFRTIHYGDFLGDSSFVRNVKSYRKKKR